MFEPVRFNPNALDATFALSFFTHRFDRTHKNGKLKPQETATTPSGMKQRWPRVPPGAAGAAARATTAIAVLLRPQVAQVGQVAGRLPLCLRPETSLAHSQALQAVRGALAARGRPVRGSLAVPTVAAARAVIRRPTSAARRRARYLRAAWVSPPRAPLRVCRLKSTNLRCLRLRRRCLRAYEAASF